MDLCNYHMVFILLIPNIYISTSAIDKICIVSTKQYIIDDKGTKKELEKKKHPSRKQYQPKTKNTTKAPPSNKQAQLNRLTKLN